MGVEYEETIQNIIDIPLFPSYLVISHRNPVEIPVEIRENRR
jgi:hypothetical protein